MKRAPRKIKGNHPPNTTNPSPTPNSLPEDQPHPLIDSLPVQLSPKFQGVFLSSDSPQHDAAHALPDQNAPTPEHDRTSSPPAAKLAQAWRERVGIDFVFKECCNPIQPNKYCKRGDG